MKVRASNMSGIHMHVKQKLNLQLLALHVHCESHITHLVTHRSKTLSCATYTHDIRKDYAIGLLSAVPVL